VAAPVTAGGALVVGASTGIGRAIVSQLAVLGRPVCAAARRQSLLDELAAQCGPLVLAARCDAADAQDCAGVVARAAAWAGEHGSALDTVVYSAGTAPLGPVRETDAAQWHHLLAVNLVGAALVARAAFEPLRKAEGGTLVLLSSHSSGDPWPGIVPYGASKAALGALARGLRVEEPDIRTVVINVGNTATSFADDWDPAEAGTAVEDWLARGYLRHEVLRADDVAGAIVAAITRGPGGPDDVDVIGPEVS
jgi:NAD(P)-dependent dehydrogenase (short-subunit alcohol dehydrogenase family)